MLVTLGISLRKIMFLLIKYKKMKERGVSSLFNRREAEEFEEFIQLMDLVGVPLMGRNFTGFNLEGSACSRLDRFLISDQLFDLWKIEGLMVGDISLSDHCPI